MITDDDGGFGARLREARLAKGWGQEDLAHAAGIRAQSVSRMERGAMGAGKSLVPLARALDVDPAYLLYGTTTADTVAEDAPDPDYLTEFFLSPFGVTCSPKERGHLRAYVRLVDVPLTGPSLQLELSTYRHITGGLAPKPEKPRKISDSGERAAVTLPGERRPPRVASK